MGQPFIGEIRMFAGNFPPAGWAICNGAPMPISENDVLFQLIGTTYGGDGEETFNLPDLQSRVPIHQGTNSFGTTYTIGEAAGVEQVTLSVQQIPSHSHPMVVSLNNGSTASPDGAMPGVGTSVTIFRPTPPPPAIAMDPGAAGIAGGSQPHDNMMPFICINYIISLFGIFPTQN